MLNIDQLKYDFNRPFLDIIEGLESNFSIYTHTTIYSKNKEEYFFLSKRTKELHYCYNTVSFELNNKYNLDYDTIRWYIRDMFDKHITKIDNFKIFCFRQ